MKKVGYSKLIENKLPIICMCLRKQCDSDVKWYEPNSNLMDIIYAIVLNDVIP